MTKASNTADQEGARLCEDANRLLNEGRYVAAHERLMAALSVAPGNPLIHYRLGLLFSDLARLPEALNAYDAAISLHPTDPKSHNNRGSILQRMGRLDEAELAFRRSMELGPKLAPPYVNLGNLHFQRGRKSDAIAIFESAIVGGLNADVFGQYIAAIAGQTSPRSPDSWVQDTFDNFAPVFDQHLRALGYEVPRDLAVLVRKHLQVAGLETLDLGCGTGLCGVGFADMSKTLVGVDLSPRMLAIAGQRQVYDALQQCEILAWLRSASAATYDAVVAADVFIYIGLLDDIFGEVARTLRPGGWFAFSVEENDGQGFVLRQSGRYAQSPGYIEDLARAAFRIVEAVGTVIRMERGVPIPGRLYVLQRV